MKFMKKQIAYLALSLLATSSLTAHFDEEESRNTQPRIKMPDEPLEDKLLIVSHLLVQQRMYEQIAASPIYADGDRVLFRSLYHERVSAARTASRIKKLLLSKYNVQFN